jgi:hypothetical protein
MRSNGEPSPGSASVSSVCPPYPLTMNVLTPTSKPFDGKGRITAPRNSRTGTAVNPSPKGFRPTSSILATGN